MDCCTKSGYNKVITIAVLQTVISAVVFIFSLIGFMLPSKRDYVLKYYPFENYKNVENSCYCVFSIVGFVFGVILFFGAKKKSYNCCKWWIQYSVVSYLLNRFDSTIALASINLEIHGEYIIAVIVYVLGVMFWFGYSIWTVYKFMLSLKVDPEVKGTGFYANMDAESHLTQGPAYYKLEPVPVPVLVTVNRS